MILSKEEVSALRSGLIRGDYKIIAMEANLAYYTVRSQFNCVENCKRAEGYFMNDEVYHSALELVNKRNEIHKDRILKMTQHARKTA